MCAWPDGTPQAHMRPNDSDVGMALEELFQFIEVNRFSSRHCKWQINIVMEQHYQACFRCEVKYAVESWIAQAGNLSRYLGRDELLVNGELANATEHPGKSLQHPANVIGGVHVGWIK